jgi:hypothetical protein
MGETGVGRVEVRGRVVTKNGKPWIGDQVHDEEAQRDGIITDVRAGVYVLARSTGPVSGRPRTPIS